MARTRTKKVKNLSAAEYRACHSLNLRREGLMQGELESYRAYRNGGWAVMIWDKDRLLGWALVFESYSDKYDAYYYVRKSERRNGVGKRLVKATTKRFGKVRVWPHDKGSNKFFTYIRKSGMKVDIQDEDDW